ncbi:radical SAM protein [Phaeobacter gallaeciensis]|uniref:radical SAM protein n=1 Tax=Phaeobacter gallaeciensis TaxID=60890 RepID=UPI00237F935C|nr:radical SAM protein [Phaeobacter gallaeciensis]MDE4099726.1 radical SAM protein [Phaeobacter gallaeciensis]MDE4108539.1 radical SAM protein [Phaeobacter gallaeciensis]MDE4110445.1 radical SAM protein [Phaeobacter gallaeciensis]MDE4117367.1 radical SAM protein [Phaeobacter gallaeciensis]MDE4121841.1 radical SAM protein [Phaeobacter gallaeciensis]
MLDANPSKNDRLNFLWLELTNRCNLNCRHCYAASGPFEPNTALDVQKYLKILCEAQEAGCRSVQFIGGEPTLNPDLSILIEKARALGFEKIEVFSNLNSLRDDLLETFVECRVDIATSIYGSSPEVHDCVTTVPGSFTRLVRNIERCLARGLRLRAGFIEMDANAGEFENAMRFFQELGVKDIGHDYERKVGRAADDKCCGMAELCGECAKGTLAVGPDGTVSPCIMSKAWPVGTLVSDISLHEVLNSEALSDTRELIRSSVEARRLAEPEKMICAPKTCAPYDANDCAPIRGGCNPCYPKG